MTGYYGQKPLSEKWMKAAVIGSLWATVEIILGSLLHNLKIPLAGSILSFITVYLVISFFQIWKMNGIIWRAGLICALMKSISPSAIILGPMLGILSQALILELIIRCIGKNPVAYTLGGALAVFSALVQKAATLLVLYGWDILVLLENMYLFATRQLRIETLQPSYLLIIISIIYLLSGTLAGFMGYKAGKNYLKNPGYLKPFSFVNHQIKSGLFNFTEKQSHSLSLLFFIFILLIGIMFIITHASLIISAFITFFFAVFIYVRYKQNMGYLKKPSIWGQIALILVFSAVFHDGFSMGQIFRTDGLIVGLKMIFRALVILSGFSAISKELKNPVIKNIMYNRGLRNLYQSLELAFSALPGIMEAFSAQTQKIHGFKKLTYAMLNSSNSLLESLISFEKNRPIVFIICGEVNNGKTTFTKKIVSRLQANGLHIRGFFSTKNSNDPSGYSYYIEDITSEKKQMLCSESYSPASIKSGRFYFLEKGLTLGRQILLQTIQKPTDLIVADELGPLEINDRGWAQAIGYLLNHSKTPHLWVVRERLVKAVVRKWNIGDVYVYDIKKDTIADIVNCITGNLKKTNNQNS